MSPSCPQEKFIPEYFFIVLAAMIATMVFLFGYKLRDLLDPGLGM